jgi:hypothetical protein
MELRGPTLAIDLLKQFIIGTSCLVAFAIAHAVRDDACRRQRLRTYACFGLIIYYKYNVNVEIKIIIILYIYFRFEIYIYNLNLYLII